MPPVKFDHKIDFGPATMAAISRLSTALENLISVIPTIRKFNEMSADLDTAITNLQASVSAETDATASATTLMSNLSQLLADAIAAAQAAGATPAELQAVSDLQATIDANTASLAASVTANTPTP